MLWIQYHDTSSIFFVLAIMPFHFKSHLASFINLKLEADKKGVLFPIQQKFFFFFSFQSNISARTKGILIFPREIQQLIIPFSQDPWAKLKCLIKWFWPEKPNEDLFHPREHWMEALKMNEIGPAGVTVQCTNHTQQFIYRFYGLSILKDSW